MASDLPTSADTGAFAQPRGQSLGRFLQQFVLVAGLLLVVAAALAAVLGAVGWWRVELVAPVLLGATIGLVWLVRDLPLARIELRPALALLLIAVLGGAWMSATSSTQMLPRRDAGSNLQAAISLADTGSRIVSIDPASIAAPASLRIPGVSLASPAFFQVGSSAEPAIEPQFVIGPAAVYSLGYWSGGLESVWAMPPWLTAIGLLVLGLLTAVILGGWWGALAALALTGCFPIVHTGRSTYSEPLALVTLGCGLLAWLLAVRAETDGARPPDPALAPRGSDPVPASRSAGASQPSRSGDPSRVGQSARARFSGLAQGSNRLALLAGILIGATAFVRVDGVRETLLALPVIALGLVQRRQWPRPLLWGLGLGTAFAAIAGLALSREYLGAIAGSLVPLLALGLILALGSSALVAGARRGWRLPAAARSRLPMMLGLATLGAGAALASRPWWQRVRQDPDDPGAHVVAGLQLRQGLPVDGGRTYAEQSIAWLSWWVGVPALVVALVALAVAVRVLARTWVDGSPLPGWAGPLVVAAGSTVLTLYRPGITPDHPWADRRLVVALPFVTILVIAAAARLGGGLNLGAGRAGRAGPARRASAVPRSGRRWSSATGTGLAVLTVVALLGPTFAATWPHRGERVELGSREAIAALCSALRPGDVVLAVDGRSANEWPQVVRGMCGHPALATASSLRGDPAAISAAIADIGANLGPDRRLVLLAADTPDDTTADAGKPTGAEVLAGLGAEVINPVNVTVREDERLLEARPDGLADLPLRVWIGIPGSAQHAVAGAAR